MIHIEIRVDIYIGINNRTPAAMGVMPRRRSREDIILGNTEYIW
jgi:hypothetical protein